MVLKYGHLAKDSAQAYYEIRLVKPDEVNQVYTLQQKVYDALENPEIFATDSEAVLREATEGMGAILGVFLKSSVLIAYRYIRFPGDAPDNLGLDVGIPSNGVVHLESTVVDPLYRGNRLQQITLKVAEALVRQWGYRHLMCTVSPENLYSLKNVMRAGLEIKALKRKYANDRYPTGVWRFILHKDLLNPRMMDPLVEFACDPAGIEAQISLIESGYVGYKLSNKNAIHYAPKSNLQ